MKKRTFILAILFTVSASIIHAEALDYHLGGGYNGYFPGNDSVHPEFSIGLSLFGGIGYGVLPLLSLGGEYCFAHNWAFDEDLSGLSVSMNSHIPLAYAKISALKLITFTILGGIEFQDIIVEEESAETRSYPTAGIRLNALFSYFQYSLTFGDEIGHRISAGVSLNR